MFRLIVLLSVLILLAGLFVVFQRTGFVDDAADTNQDLPSSSVSSHDPWQEFLDEHFAYDQACAECHAEEFAAHQRSGHSHTATLALNTNLGQALLKAVYEDPRRDQSFFFEAENDLIRTGEVGVNSSAIFPVQWVLGSGIHAQTAVSIDPSSRYGVEFRWSWFAKQQMLGVTPDHERFDDYRPKSIECFGRPLEPEQALACLNCHMTAVPPSSTVPTFEAFVPNVGCERCHGPRKKHVEFARLGKAEEIPPLFSYDDPEVFMQQCAQCHRDETNVPDDSSPNSLARYQPYGLKKSACYKQSGQKLTCSDCHDPHDTVSHDLKAYVNACNRCHSQGDQVVCPENPVGNCVDCHMPKVEWQSGIEFHDHWIRVFRDGLDTSK